MDISSLRERGSVNAMSVTELNNFIKNIFESNRTLTSITVKAEISNFTNHRSGHLYFSLKDSDSQIRAVMFRSSAQKLKFIPENGMKVLAHGSVSVYAKDGSYQLYVNSLQPDGVGTLYLAYEQLKAKLEAEGLFSYENKKQIPAFPERIGVITSPTGAAVRDIINVTGRRFPLAKIYLYPSLVQGEGAEDNLIKALDYFDKTALVDTIIIGRGGGSIEDLWAFNSERLARKIFDMKIPIISAVGHETDFTICDFVSDMRAPTPSAAAELAVPDAKELLLTLSDAGERIINSLLRFSERKRERVDVLYEKLALLSSSFFTSKKERIDSEAARLFSVSANAIKDKRSNFLIMLEKLNALNPLSVMKRGYLVAEKDGSLIKRSSDISVGDELELRLLDSVVKTTVNEIREVENK